MHDMHDRYNSSRVMLQLFARDVTCSRHIFITNQNYATLVLALLDTHTDGIEFSLVAWLSTCMKRKSTFTFAASHEFFVLCIPLALQP
jgi:hypothetical protein